MPLQRKTKPIYMTEGATVLALKSNEKGLLWINRERKRAAFHDGNTSYAVRYTSALAVLRKASVNLISEEDGETYAPSTT